MELVDLRTLQEVTAGEASAEWERATQEEARRKETAQIIGASNESRYANMVGRFQGLFWLLYNDRLEANTSDIITATPEIVLAVTAHGPITATVTTLSHQAPEIIHYTLGPRPAVEQLPDFREAENFKVVYHIMSEGQKKDKEEKFAAKRNATGMPASYPWPAEGEWIYHRAKSIETELDNLLIAADQTLSMLRTSILCPPSAELEPVS